MLLPWGRTCLCMLSLVLQESKANYSCRERSNSFFSQLRQNCKQFQAEIVLQRHKTDFMSSQWKEVDKAGMVSPTSTQTVQKSSTDIVWGELTMAEGVPSQENKTKAEASVMTTEKLVLEVPEESAMGTLFTEVQLLAGTGPNIKLIEVSELVIQH